MVASVVDRLTRSTRSATFAACPARGEALAFLAKSTEYERAPEITRQWMYLKTMTQVLVGLEEKVVIEDGRGNSVAKHLPLKDFFPPIPMASKAGGAK